MKIIRMPVFAILILLAMLYLVATIIGKEPGIAKDVAKPADKSASSGSKASLHVADDKTLKRSVDQSQPEQMIGKSIELPHYQPDFPPGNGKDLFISRCGVCHSLRYVTMQPDFPKKTWAKEVDKMIKTFGAHIDKKEADEIIEYLNSIKGKPVTEAKTATNAPASKGQSEKH